MGNKLLTYPKVSIVSVNYNQPEVTCELLDSLRLISYPNVEVIIVDNGSTTSNQHILQFYPEVNLIVSKHNLGFAGGNNLGIKAATGKYILMLNNDTEVEKDFLEPLIAHFENDNTVGIVSSKILYHKNQLIQYAGATPLNKITSRNRYYGNKMKDNGDYDKAIDTAYPHGASMILPKAIYLEIGELYEGYFLYYEELDFAERVKNAGYRILMEPKSIVYHKESISTGKNSPLKTYYLNRNRLLFLRRNLKGLNFLLAACYFIFISIPKNTLKYLFDMKNLLALYKGVLWNFINYNIHQKTPN